MAGERAGNLHPAHRQSFRRARGSRQACRPGTKVFGLLGRHSRRKPQKLIRHLRPSVVARRLVGVLRCASDMFHMSAHSQQSKPRIRLRMHEVVSRRIDVHGQEPFGLEAGTGLNALPMFAGRAGRASQPVCISAGKVPRALNLARGVSDELRGAFSRVGAWLVDPHSRPPTLFRLAAARTRRQLRAQHLVASCQPVPSFRLAS